MSRPQSTGLIVPVDAARGLVAPWRHLLPAAGRSLPPHVTALWPFLPVAALDAAAERRLEELLAGAEPFAFALTRVATLADASGARPRAGGAVRRAHAAAVGRVAGVPAVRRRVRRHRPARRGGDRPLGRRPRGDRGGARAAAAARGPRRRGPPRRGDGERRSARAAPVHARRLDRPPDAQPSPPRALAGILPAFSWCAGKSGRHRRRRVGAGMAIATARRRRVGGSKAKGPDAPCRLLRHLPMRARRRRPAAAAGSGNGWPTTGSSCSSPSRSPSWPTRCPRWRTPSRRR